MASARCARSATPGPMPAGAAGPVEARDVKVEVHARRSTGRPRRLLGDRCSGAGGGLEELDQVPGRVLRQDL